MSKLQIIQVSEVPHFVNVYNFKHSPTCWTGDPKRTRQLSEEAVSENEHSVLAYRLHVFPKEKTSD